VTNARAFYTTRAAAGATGTRLSLRPLFFEAKDFAQLGRTAPREGEGVSSFSVIARSEATKQSILSLCGEMDCFASLAMTACFSSSTLSPGPRAESATW
jgi:hypothetical protein